MPGDIQENAMRRVKTETDTYSNDGKSVKFRDAYTPERIGEMPDGRKKYASALVRLAIEIAVLALFLLVTFRFFFGIAVQHGNDMYPALKDGDIVLYYRTSDLVNTEACVYRTDDGIRTGRIAATEGIEISSTGDMQLTFDGVYLPPEPSSGIYERTYAGEQQILPVTVGEGFCFILGDNRAEAADSRIYGQISRGNICGRIIAVFRRRQI